MNEIAYFPDHEALGLPPIPDAALVSAIHTLRGMDFLVAPRDPNLNYAFEGKYMVCENYSPGHRQACGTEAEQREGEAFTHPVWCVVGDDVAELVWNAVRFFDLEAMG